MPARHVRVLPTTAELAPALDAIREELKVPDSFPPDVDAEAAAAVARGPILPPGVGAGAIADERGIPLVTIDPEGSRDLDQAYFAQRRPGGGYRVFYAIADVNAFVMPGGALDRESRARGVTLYQPDRRTPLYPEALGQGVASLLPDQDRQALLWTIDLDADALPMGRAVCRRTLVRSRAALNYPEVQATIDAHTGPGPGDDALMLLREIGRLREQREADRGGISLQLPDQEVVIEDGHADLRFAAPLPVEGWNAQISLLTGIVAAGIMTEGRLGILRTLPPPDPGAVAAFRRNARALGVEFPESMSYPDAVRSLDPGDTKGAVLLTRAAHTLRGAGYSSFDGDLPAQPVHAAVASTYAHVTAPLRRLADRFANEVVLALLAGMRPPDWVLASLPTLPEAMAAASHREHELERAVVDAVEASLLRTRVGETFEATVVSVDQRSGRATIELREPAVLGSVHDEPDKPGRPGEARSLHRLRAGAAVRVRLVEADPLARRIRFEVA